MARPGLKLAAASLTALVLATASAAETGNGPILYADGNVVFQIRADGSGRTAISPTEVVDPTLSPDGTQVAYLSKVAGVSAGRDLYVMRVDGSGQRLLASYPETGSAAPVPDLTWSPDSTKLAYLAPATGTDPLRIVDVASGLRLAVPADGTGKLQLAWSPDGKEIAFAVPGPTGYSGIDVETLATGAVRNVAPPQANSATWSPDGTRIAYADANGGEWVVDREGGFPRRLDVPVGLTPDYPSPPVWSRDGRTIYFSEALSIGAPYALGLPAIHFGLFAVKADGTGQTFLRNGVKPLGWSPAGDALVVARSYYSFSPVYFIRPDGRCLTFVTQGDYVGWEVNDSAPPPFECVDLTLQATAPATTGRSGVKFHLLLGNAGSLPATPHVVQRFDEAVTPVAYDRRVCMFTANAFHCVLAPLDPGRQETLDVTVRTQPSVLHSTVDVGYPGRDSDPASNEQTTRTHVDKCWLLGTPGPDTLRGANRGELICGLGGDDRIFPGGGPDVVRAEGGDDVIYAAGGGRDVISCGVGDDLVVADPSDYVSRDCEHVARTR